MTRLRRARWHPTLNVLAILLVAWWVLPGLAHAPKYIIPPLPDVASTLVRMATDGTLLKQAATSLGRYVVAVIIGISLGVGAGLVLASSRAVARLIGPVLIFVQSIAGVAWLPLAIIWFGLGTAPLVFVVVNISFFIMLTNTITGVTGISPTHKYAVRTLGATRWSVYREVVLPGALPSILTGARLAVGFGWQAMVAAEVIAAGSGLGWLATTAGQRFDSATVIVAILTIGLLGFSIDQFALRPLEARTIQRWGLVT